MVGYIRLLEVLSSQEFVFNSEDDMSLADNVECSLPPGEVDVGGVVSMGLVVLTRVVTTELLEHFPSLQSSFFSIMSYALALCEHILPSMAKNGGDGGTSTNEILRGYLGISDEDMVGLFRNLLSLLLWGVTASLSSSTARSALQGIQNCAVSHIKSGMLNYLNFEMNVDDY